MATEQEYDEIIAPMLLDVAKKCEELGMSIVARVEWQVDGAGITHIGVAGTSVAQQLTDMSALSRGNIDAVLLECVKRFDVSQSIFLHGHNKKSAANVGH